MKKRERERREGRAGSDGERTEQRARRGNERGRGWPRGVRELLRGVGDGRREGVRINF